MDSNAELQLGVDMRIIDEPRSLLCLRKTARKLWREPAMQRKWLRAYLRARGWGGLVIEGAPSKWRAS